MESHHNMLAGVEIGLKVSITNFYSSFFKPRLLALDAFWENVKYGFDI